MLFWALLNSLICPALPAATPQTTPAPATDADRAWQLILEHASGPPTNVHSEDEALAAAREHFDKQEAALRDFVRLYPGDPRRFSARIRLSSVLAAKSRLLHQPALRAEAIKILDDMETNPEFPRVIKADAGFARVGEAMEDAAGRLDGPARDALLKAVRQFDMDYPGDRRMPGLLTELATVYDAEPARKKALLEEALGRATDEPLRRRIADDLRRTALLGHPLEVRLQPWQGGAPIDLASRRGHAVVLLFWASWSLPALHELARLEKVAGQYDGQPVDFLTVSLDEDRAALAATIRVASLRWPVHCDGRGWQGELVRSLGINALPTVWVLDRHGNLLTLNARDQAAEFIDKALAGK